MYVLPVRPKYSFHIIIYIYKTAASTDIPGVFTEVEAVDSGVTVCFCVVVDKTDDEVVSVETL